MIRRLFWMIAGAGLALYTRSKVLQSIEKYVPAPMARAIARTANHLKSEVVEVSKDVRKARSAAKTARDAEFRER
jgi:predicted unusual protein kinase regulating ubiquinone biosynthesis (AarF/ABC1/UbiB family)